MFVWTRWLVLLYLIIEDRYAIYSKKERTAKKRILIKDTLKDNENDGKARWNGPTWYFVIVISLIYHCKPRTLFSYNILWEEYKAIAEICANFQHIIGFAFLAVIKILSWQGMT